MADVEADGVFTGEEAVVVAVSRARHGTGDVVAEGPVISIAVRSGVDVCGEVGQEDGHVLSNVAHHLTGRRHQLYKSSTMIQQ